MATHELEISVSSKTQSTSALTTIQEFVVSISSKTQSASALTTIQELAALVSSKTKSVSALSLYHWLYVQYESSIVAYDVDRILLWLSANTHCYFAIKASLTGSWTYFAGDVNHKLVTDSKLTNYGTAEVAAQTNYLQTVRDPNGRVKAVLPSFQQTKYVKVFIDDTEQTTLYEFWPETFAGREIDFKLAVILGAI